MSDQIYNSYSILFVDDEEKTRKYFARLFGEKFNILLAEDGVSGLQVLQDNLNDVALVVTDQRMPNMTGSQFLEKVAEIKPSCVKILSTAYSDIEAAVDAVNKGGIYQYITKPWEVNELEVSLMRAYELFVVQQERDSLLKQKLSSVEMLASSDRILSIATLAVFQHENLRHVGVALRTLVELAEAGAEDAGESVVIDPSLNWRELYCRHLEFLRSIRDGLTGEELQGDDLDYRQTSQLMDVVHPLTEELGCFEWIGDAGQEVSWPGSVGVLQKAISPLLEALSDLMRDAGVVLISAIDGGIELKLASRLLAKNLAPFRSATKNSPSSHCIKLAAAVFKLAHTGAGFEVLPESRRDMIRFRVTYDLKKDPVAGGSGWSSLVEALAGNDVFWARYGN